MNGTARSDEIMNKIKTFRNFLLVKFKSNVFYLKSDEKNAQIVTRETLCKRQPSDERDFLVTISSTEHLDLFKGRQFASDQSRTLFHSACKLLSLILRTKCKILKSSAYLTHKELD